MILERGAGARRPPAVQSEGNRDQAVKFKALRKLLGAPALLALWVLPLAAARAADPGALDVEYAEHQPLAAHSLLLDILRLPSGRFVAVGARGHVVHSDDGESWTQAEVVPTRSTLTSLTRANGRLWAAGHDSVIITSGDGGRNWTVQYFDPDRQQPIMDIHFFDDEHGLAIGAYGLALVTRDGGRQWEDTLINEEEWHNNAVLSIDDGPLLVAGEAGFSYRSEDRGASWETLEMPYPGSMFGAVAGREGCALFFGLRGHVQQSCDGGVRWEELASGTEASIAGGVRVAGRSVMVGNSGLVLELDDSGAFSAHYHSSGVDLAAIVPDGTGGFLMAGEDGLHRYPEAEAHPGD